MSGSDWLKKIEEDKILRTRTQWLCASQACLLIRDQLESTNLNRDIVGTHMDTLSHLASLFLIRSEGGGKTPFSKYDYDKALITLSFAMLESNEYKLIKYSLDLLLAIQNNPSREFEYWVS